MISGIKQLDVVFYEKSLKHHVFLGWIWHESRNNNTYNHPFLSFTNMQWINVLPLEIQAVSTLLSGSVWLDFTPYLGGKPSLRLVHHFPIIAKHWHKIAAVCKARDTAITRLRSKYVCITANAVNKAPNNGNWGEISSGASDVFPAMSFYRTTLASFKLICAFNASFL